MHSPRGARAHRRCWRSRRSWGSPGPRSRLTRPCAPRACSAATSRPGMKRWWCRSTPARAPIPGTAAGRFVSTARRASRCPGRGLPRRCARDPAPARSLTLVVRRVAASPDAPPRAPALLHVYAPAGCGSGAESARGQHLRFTLPETSGLPDDPQALPTYLIELGQKLRFGSPFGAFRAGTRARARRGALQGRGAVAARTAEPADPAQAGRDRLRPSRCRHGARTLRALGAAPQARRSRRG